MCVMAISCVLPRQKRDGMMNHINFHFGVSITFGSTRKNDLIQDHQDGPGYLLLLVLRLRRFSSLAYRHGMDGLMQKHIKHKAHGCQAWPFGDILLTSLRLYNTTHFPSRKIDP